MFLKFIKTCKSASLLDSMLLIEKIYNFVSRPISRNHLLACTGLIRNFIEGFAIMFCAASAIVYIK